MFIIYTIMFIATINNILVNNYNENNEIKFKKIKKEEQKITNKSIKDKQEIKQNILENKLSINNYTNIKNKTYKNNSKDYSNKIGEIIIPKIDINNNLYSIGSNENNIEKNITILSKSFDPKIKNTAIFIAAHSGTGPIAFFKNLNKLELNDKVILKYNNKIYKYKIIDIFEQPKTGSINIEKYETNQLILTTCSPNHKGYQLVINCIIE